MLTEAVILKAIVAAYRYRNALSKASGGGVILRKGLDLGPDAQADGGTGPVGTARAAQAGGHFSRYKASKAGSAEAILTACLKARGWLKRWQKNKLTPRQHLALLEDIRQYGRAWLRHEAQAFFAAYGVTDGDDIQGNAAGALREEDRGVPQGSGVVREAGFGEGQAESAGGGAGPVLAGSSETRGLGGRLLSPVRRFFERTRQFVHELIFAGTMALKGPEPLTAAETTAVDGQALVQAFYLEKFRNEVIANPPRELIDPADIQTHTTVVQPPPMTPGQFVARAEKYANAAHQAPQRVVRESVITTGVMKLERRVLGNPRTEHCHDCPPIAAMGWQPLGSLPHIGDSECNGRCLCHFEYRSGLQLPGQAPVKPTVNTNPPRKITLKSTPNTKAKRLKREPTHEEIKAEVDKFVKGEPTVLTVSDISPRVVKPLPPTPAPAGYTHYEAEYDADGNLVFQDID